MSVKQSFKYLDETTMQVVVTVPKDQYQEFSDKIINQLAKNIEVKGFRKGKAPLNIAMQKMDMQSAQNTVLNESLSVFVDPNLKPAQEALRADKRSIFKTELKDVQAQENGDMEFIAELYITPNFDYKKLYSFKLPEITKSEMPVRFSKEEYMEKEINEFIASFTKFTKEAKKVAELSKVKANMIMSMGDEPSQAQEIELVIGTRSCPAEFSKDLMGKKVGDKIKTQTSFNMGMANPVSIPVELEILAIMDPASSKFEDIVKENPKAKERFASEKEMKKEMETIYDNETATITKELQFKKVIKEIQKSLLSHEFKMERFTTGSVVDRTKEDAKKRGLEWIDYLKSQNILDESKKYTEKQAEAELLEVYKSEELYLQLLRNIYDFEIVNKITDQEIQATVDNLKNGAHKGHTHSADEYREMALDNLVRSKALNHLLRKIQENSQDSSKPKKANTEEKAKIKKETKKDTKKKAEAKK